MKKIVLAALAALYALSTPAFASIVADQGSIQQEEGGEKKQEKERGD